MILRTKRTETAPKTRKSERSSGHRGLRARKIDCLSIYILLSVDTLFCISHARKPRCPLQSFVRAGRRYLISPSIEQAVGR